MSSKNIGANIAKNVWENIPRSTKTKIMRRLDWNLNLPEMTLEVELDFFMHTNNPTAEFFEGKSKGANNILQVRGMIDNSNGGWTSLSVYNGDKLLYGIYYGNFDPNTNTFTFNLKNGLKMDKDVTMVENLSPSSIRIPKRLGSQQTGKGRRTRRTRRTRRSYKK